MQRIFMFLYLLIACIFTTNLLSAKASKDKQEVKNDLRILELLPLICPLAVDPGIPSNFIAMSPTGTLDPYDWIYWGPEKVLKAYFDDPSSLKVPILRVRITPNIVQTDPNSILDKESFERLKQVYSEGFACIETQWGDYPILAIRTRIEGQLIFMAWVGLNDPEAGLTLLFNLVYPDKKGHPNKVDRDLWKNLLTKTTKLKDGDYFKACGQDLQEGYTILNLGGAKLKMVAEKRLRDGAIQVVVIPESPDIEFHYTDMKECAMGAEWKHGEPMVKVYGDFVITNENVVFSTSYVTSVFFKTVPEFSSKKESGTSLIFQKICDKKDNPLKENN